MADRKLIVQVVGDASSLNRTFAQATQTTKLFGREIDVTSTKLDRTLGRFSGRGIGGGVAAFAGGAAAAGALDQLNKAAEASSALDEQVNKSRVVFGAFSEDVERFGKTTADAFGISNRAAVEAAGTFGGLFTTVGVGQEQAAQLADTLVGLSGDLSSFFDAVPSDVLTALRSGLIGEAEPLRRFNVLLSETRVQAEALRQTGKGSVKELTDEEKVRARLAIILRDTVQAQGDAARTSDSLANKQRRLNAQLEDSRARIGKLVVPIKSQLIGALSDAAVAADKLADALELVGSIEIPEIKIPFVMDFGGGTAGDFVEEFKKRTGPDAPERLARFLGGQFKTAYNKAAEEINQNVLRGNILQIPDIGVEPVTSSTKKAGEAATKSGKGFLDFVDAVNAAIAAARATIQPVLAQAAALEKLQTASDNAALAVARVGLAQEEASGTPTLADDIEALKDRAVALAAQERAIRAQLALSKDDKGLQQDLVDVQRDQISNENALNAAVRQRAENQKSAAREAARLAKEQSDRAREAARTAEQARQFRALGLSPEGDKPIPTIDNLTKQLDQLDAKISGGKNQRVLNAIRKVLVDPVHTATEETRAAIRDMFADIRGEFDKGEPLTPFHKANARKLLGGIGLDPEELKAAARVVSRIGQGGLVSSGSAGGAFGLSPGLPILPSNETNVTVVVELDSEEIYRKTTKRTEKDQKRNTSTRTGPRGGI